MSQDITRLLHEMRNGSTEAVDHLFEAAYNELRVLARSQLRSRAGETLQTTALVHEAYLKLFDASQLDAKDRAHFFALAARAMRQVLVDHFRRKGAAKRGGHAVQLSLNDGDIPIEDRGEVLLAVDEALGRLMRVEERLGRVVECKFFGGMTEVEIGAALGVTDRTVRNDWRKAKAWLSRELAP